MTAYKETQKGIFNVANAIIAIEGRTDPALKVKEAWPDRNIFKPSRDQYVLNMAVDRGAISVVFYVPTRFVDDSLEAMAEHMTCTWCREGVHMHDTNGPVAQEIMQAIHDALAPEED